MCSTGVSVIMGIHKIDTYTYDSISSVLLSKNVNFELIIVANGPNYKFVFDYLTEKFHHLGNVKIFSTPIAQLSFALNLAISNSCYDYIARMDSDDLCSPDRLNKQYSYLKKNNLDLVGCNIYLINENSDKIGFRVYPKKDRISKVLRFKSSFCHPSTMYRKNKILSVGGYNSGFNSEDYDLWIRLNRSGVIWDNMDEKLLSYRIHSNSSQGSRLAYAEVFSIFSREMILNFNFYNASGFFFSLIKAIIKK